jgi:hypothetical protein
MGKELPDELKGVMGQVAEVFDGVLQKHVGRKMGFAILLFDFGNGGNMNFITNADARQMVVALRELADNIEKELQEMVGLSGYEN